MKDLAGLPTRGEGGVHVLIEMPRGSREKWRYEPSLGSMVRARPLTAGLVYPHDWGIVPSTLSAALARARHT